VVRAKSQLAVVLDDTPAEECRMEFRLLYSGRILGASRTDTRAALKHQIRREFHPQLRRLWQTNLSLRRMLKFMGTYYFDKQHPRDYNLQNLGAPPDVDEAEEFYRDFATEVILKQWARCGYRFWPLVTEEHSLKCSLDILFLRPEEPGMLVRSGDIDGRIKMISEIKVTTDSLLLLPQERDMKPNDAFLVIHVKLWPTESSGWNWAFA